MNRFISFLYGLVLALALASLLSCCATTSDLPAPTAGPIDSSLRAAGLNAGKIKITGPVTFQVGGKNNTATSVATNNTKAGQRQGTAATGAGAKAQATNKNAGTPWWLWALFGVGCIVAWEALSRRLVPTKWLPWRVLSS
jgi:hypothetical protein